jgi:nicotinamidase-related amidase
MTTLGNRPNAAPVVVDMQNGVIATAHARAAVVAKIGVLVEQARRDRIPVICIQHADKQLARGSNECHIVPDLTPRDAQPLVEKHFGDTLEDTHLEKVLMTLGVGQLFLAGARQMPVSARLSMVRSSGVTTPHL